MSDAIVALCKALAQVLNAHYHSLDRETGNLMTALAAYVTKYQKNG